MNLSLNVASMTFTSKLLEGHKRINDLSFEIINHKKAPGFDLINGEILKQLPRKAIIKLSHLNNALFRLSYVPRIWK